MQEIAYLHGEKREEKGCDEEKQRRQIGHGYPPAKLDR
jgi:hypothetical protein